MKLDTEITVSPPPVTDNQTNKIVQPPAIVLNELNVTYHDNPTNKTLTASINQIPGTFTLAAGTNYDAVGDYTHSELEELLRASLGTNIAARLRAQFPRTLEENPNGPGTILTGMISALGIKSTSTCSCRRHALEMNEKGTEWCEKNMDVILSWLKEESNKRSLPYVETVARMMVNRAIAKSKRLLAEEAKNKTTDARPDIVL